MVNSDPQTHGRIGLATRSRIRDTALRLFTERGFEGTSTKDLADELGITKSSLYYYFSSKDAIVLSLLEERQHEIDDLLAWVRAQPAEPGLAGRAAVRWVDGLDEGVLQGMRFARANRPVMRRLGGAGAASPFGFHRIIDALVPENGTDADRLRVAALFEAGSSVVLAADDLDVNDAEALKIAREVVRRLAATAADAVDGRPATRAPRRAAAESA